MKEKQSLLAQGKLLEPKLDVVFHALFREDNKELLGALTSDILREEVKIKTTDKSRYVDIEEADDKLGIMDLRAELENRSTLYNRNTIKALWKWTRKNTILLGRCIFKTNKKRR